MKLIRLFFLSCLSFGISSLALAEDAKWYSVEVIVFEQGSTDTLEEEIWPFLEDISIDKKSVSLLPPETTTVTDLQAPMPVPSPFSETPVKKLKLLDIRNKLEQEEKYKVLTHTGWRQPVSASKKTPSVLISDIHSLNAFQELEPLPEEDEVVEEELAPEETMLVELVKELETLQVKPEDFPGYVVFPMMNEEDQIDEQWGLEQTTQPVNDLPKKFAPKNPVGPPELHIYGTSKLRQGRFLHLELDLYFRPYFEEEQAPAAEAPEFPMQEEQTEQEEMQAEEIKENQLLEMAGFEIQALDFQLKDSRRIHTGQINYYDHPLFGVIALITEYEPDEEKLEEIPD